MKYVPPPHSTPSPKTKQRVAFFMQGVAKMPPVHVHAQRQRSRRRARKDTGVTACVALVDVDVLMDEDVAVDDVEAVDVDELQDKKKKRKKEK